MPHIRNMLAGFSIHKLFLPPLRSFFLHGETKIMKKLNSPEAQYWSTYTNLSKPSWRKKKNLISQSWNAFQQPTLRYQRRQNLRRARQRGGVVQRQAPLMVLQMIGHLFLVLLLCHGRMLRLRHRLLPWPRRGLVLAVQRIVRVIRGRGLWDKHVRVANLRQRTSNAI